MDITRRQRKLILPGALMVATLVVFLGGCYWDSVEALHPLNGYVNPCDSTQQAIYSSAIKAIISYNCVSCHNASYTGGNVSLDSYDQVKQYAESGALINAILRKSGVNPMPPTLALPSCQTNKLLLWIKNNYPQ